MSAEDQAFDSSGAPGSETEQQIHELLNRYHHRASMSEGGQMLVDPSQVLNNIAMAMERLDTDIDTPISIEEDVVPLNELATLIHPLAMGPTLAVHVVNTAMRIMSARYPNELVQSPLPAEFDLRKIHPLTISDDQHETAKTIFNRRTTSTTDLAEEDIAADMAPLDPSGQMQVFITLFYTFGTKVGALKHRTGTQ